MAKGADAGNVAVIAEAPLFKPLGRKKAYVEVAEEIRRLILRQRLQPSHRLPTERELSAQFGVSRMVVREAIRMLERDGMLMVRKGARGGIFVTQDYNRPINDLIANLLAGGGAGLTDLFDVRRLIEPYAASLAAQLGSEEEFAGLAELIGKAQAAGLEEGALRAHNIEFHCSILRMCRNPFLSVMGEAVLMILSDRSKNLSSQATSQGALTRHRAIFDALRKRQADKAGKLMAKDIEVTGQRLAQLGPEMLLHLAANEGA
jgi:GntR family transcriptional repressor for pyruvate dehydrogenase complex